jgi:hypothetical protein
MADGSQADEDGDEGEEEDDGEEGDEGDDVEEDEDGEVDGEHEDEKLVADQEPSSNPPSQDTSLRNDVPVIKENPDSNPPDTDMSGVDISDPAPDFQVLEEKPEEILLQNIETTSILESPLHPSVVAEPISDTVPEEGSSKAEEIDGIDSVMQEEVQATAPAELPPPPPEPTAAEVEAAVEVRKEEEEEEKLLLDIVENVEAKIDTEKVSPDPPAVESEISTSEPIVEPAEAQDPTQPEIPQAESEKATAIVEPEASKEEALASDDEENDFPDLLGGLEKQLNGPAKTLDATTFEAAAEDAKVVKDDEESKEAKQHTDTSDS